MALGKTDEPHPLELVTAWLHLKPSLQLKCIEEIRTGYVPVHAVLDTVAI